MKTPTPKPAKAAETIEASKPTLQWQHSSRDRTHEAGHYGNGSKKQGHGRKWRIVCCTPWREVLQPELGYDLFLWGQKTAHGKTVKELKILAEQLDLPKKARK